MRYTVGQSYVFIRFELVNNTDNFRFGPPNPEVDTFSEIGVLNLKCVEHHKVAWDQDPEQKKEYDGYLFKDISSKLWANQYPTASYGQLDDRQNQIVRPHLDMAEYEKMSDYMKHVEGEKHMTNEYEDACIRLCAIKRHIQKRVWNPDEKIFDIENYPKWANFMNWIVTNIEFCTKKDVSFTQKEMKGLNGNSFYWPQVEIK